MRYELEYEAEGRRKEGEREIVKRRKLHRECFEVHWTPISNKIGQHRSRTVSNDGSTFLNRHPLTTRQR